MSETWVPKRLSASDSSVRRPLERPFQGLAFFSSILVALMLSVFLMAAISLVGGCRTSTEDQNPKETGHHDSGSSTVDTGTPQSLDTGTPARDITDPPTENHINYPATLRLHAQDRAGDPVAGASFVLEGRALVSNSNGNAGFSRLAPGDYTILVKADGFADQVRTVSLEEDDSLLITVTLMEQGPQWEFNTADPVVLDQGSFSVSLEGGAFVDLLGQPHDDMALATLTVYDTVSGMDDENGALQAFPASLAAMDAEGEDVQLTTYGAFDLFVTSLDGQPLQLADGFTATVRRYLPEGAGLSAGDTVPMWKLDQATGLWLEEDGLEATVEADGSDLVLVVDLPHLSVWNFDQKGDTCCIDVNIEGWEYAGSFVELEFRQGTLRRRETVDSSSDIQIVRIGCEVSELNLYNEYFLTDSLDVPGASCAEANLHIQQLVKGGAVVRFYTGDCPAAGLWLRVVSRSGDDLVFDELVHENYAMVELAELGEWMFQVYDPADMSDTANPSEPLAVQTATLEDPEQTLWVEFSDLPPAFAAEPDGGCWEQSCRSDYECHSCIQVTVLDQDDQPIPDEYVNFWDPVGMAYATGDDGQICLDIEYGAGLELLFYPDGAGTYGANLPTSAYCDLGNCVERTVWTSSETISCPEGSGLIEGSSRVMGLVDPAYSSDYSYEYPFRGGDASVSSTVVFTYRGSAGLLGICDTDIESYDSAWGFVRLRQDPSGLEYSENTVYRGEFECESGTMQFGLELDTSAELLSTGTHMAEHIPVTLSLEFVADTVSQETYQATRGEIEVDEWVSGSPILYLDLEMEQVDGGESFPLEGVLWAPLLTQADTPESFDYQLSHYQNGNYVDVVTASGRTTYGPGGLFSLDSDWPEGDLQFCVPEDGWFMLEGKDFDDSLLRPFTALFTVKDGSVTLYGNDEDEASNYVTDKARLFDRSFIEMLYEQTAHDTSGIDTGATILGCAFRWDEVEGEIEYVHDPDVLLLLNDGTGLEPDLLNDACFIFADVPPTDPETPYTLTVAGLPQYTQLVAPVAGGVMIPHN